MSYAQFTQGEFLFELSQNLGDPNHVYWSQDELARALNEALLHWGAATSYWTTRGIFNTQPSVPFYDLSQQLPLLRTRAYTLGNLIRELQYHLLEPSVGVAGTGMTDQFPVNQILYSLARKRNQFVIDTRVPLSFATIPGSATVTLDQWTALVARCAWKDTATGIVTPLRRTDSFAAQSYSPSWPQTPGKPYGYSQAESMPLTMTIVPPPVTPGQIHLVFAQTQQFAPLDATLMSVPDELVWAIKYSTLYELTSTNSQGYDPIRSKYALERYNAAVELAALHRSVLQVRTNTKLLSLATLEELDAGKPYWQGLTGPPQAAACAYDLLALYKVPNTAYPLSVDVSQAAPLPTGPGDFIQVGPEEMGYLLDYCRHILMIKIGGTEFVQSMPLFDNFLKGAAQRTKLIGYKARYLTPLFTQSALEEEQRPAA